MLTLYLKQLGILRGIYGNSKTVFPARAAYLHPEAANAFLDMEGKKGKFIWTDILRGADESLRAARSGRGAQAPGYSGHNFGLSVDMDIEQVLKERRWTYLRLCDELEEFGFHPYRADRSRGAEEWHFNFLGKEAKAILGRTSSRARWQEAAEEAILNFYPHITPMGAVNIQTALKKLKLYSGDLDGDLGPLSMTAVNLFNNTWGLGQNALGERFQRTLAFVAAERSIVV